MEEHEYCDPEDMVMFLLAICCQGNYSPAHVSRDNLLDERFNACYSSVIPIANCPGLREKLKT